jgi:hypothetical protein
MFARQFRNGEIAVDTIIHECCGFDTCW